MKGEFEEKPKKKLEKKNWKKIEKKTIFRFLLRFWNDLIIKKHGGFDREGDSSLGFCVSYFHNTKFYSILTFLILYVHNFKKFKMFEKNCGKNFDLLTFFFLKNE